MNFQHNYRRALFASLVSCALMSAGSTAAYSQSRDGQPPQNEQPAAPAAPVDVVPSEVVDRALAGDNDALAVLQAYVRGNNVKSPEAIARRTTALIAQIGRGKKDASTNSLLNVIDQIASNAINLISGSQIVRIGVDNEFVHVRPWRGISARPTARSRRDSSGYCLMMPGSAARPSTVCAGRQRMTCSMTALRASSG